VSDNGPEAVVLVNGIHLSVGQSMALRVAVGHMLHDLQDPLHLGDDEHGRFMVKAYKARLEEVQELIFRNLT
jgi:hypothetical protein